MEIFLLNVYKSTYNIIDFILFLIDILNNYKMSVFLVLNCRIIMFFALDLWVFSVRPRL